VRLGVRASAGPQQTKVQEAGSQGEAGDKGKRAKV